MFSSQTSAFTFALQARRGSATRHSWPESDFGMVSRCSRQKLAAYKKEAPVQGQDHHMYLQWSLNLLQAAFNGENVPLCSTVSVRDLDGRRYIKEVTAFHLDELNQHRAPSEPSSKRFKSVRSSHDCWPPLLLTIQPHKRRNSNGTRRRIP